MSKTFVSEKYCDGTRPVTVKVTNTFITFHFKTEGDREFYDIPTDEWISDAKKTVNEGRRWREHMASKSWVTDEMIEYIEKEVGKL